ncbi:MAG: hypothetical protein GAK43_00809 [Stenotrophomonas maltophilia]|nr:MAG: hypothetical protein GAK43_00809 [Stenotrophomonas maltophilia]
MRKVPHYWFETVADWRDAPLAYWVHLAQDGQAWHAASRFQPPAPRAQPKGYLMLCLSAGSRVLRFSSTAQVEACIATLQRVPLPTSRQLSQAHGGTLGPNRHWLSRLPGRLKSPKQRLRVVEDLRLVLAQLRSDHPFHAAAPT